jgi:hypothetical protein
MLMTNITDVCHETKKTQVKNYSLIKKRSQFLYILQDLLEKYTKEYYYSLFLTFLQSVCLFQGEKSK